MDGVTILNSFQEIVNYTWGISIVGIIILIIFGGAGIAIVIEGGISKKDYQGILIGILFFIFGCGICCTCCSNTTPVYKTHYQVVIDDSVSASEFLKHYTIIEQQGITYIVEEIEEGG